MNATATGHNSNAIGESSIATGQNAMASGLNSIAIGVGALAGGKEKEGAGSIAIGAGSNAMGTNAIAIGFGVTSSNNNEIVIGDRESTTTLGGALNVIGTSTSQDVINSGNISTSSLTTSGNATLRNLAVTSNATVDGNLTVGGAVVGNNNLVSIGTNAIQIISGAIAAPSGIFDRITTDGLAPGGADIHLGGTIISNTGVVGTTPVNVQVDGILFTNNGIQNTGTFSSTGNANIGTATGSTINVGNQTNVGVGTSTVSFNNNRLQNIAAANTGTDAVNLTQVNSLIASSMRSFASQAQVDENHLLAQSGIAGVSAIANIPALELNKKFAVGIGVGHYITASAIAISAQSRIAENIVLKLSGSSAMGNVVTGAGLGISF
jgi:autotransporter adhesin